VIFVDANVFLRALVDPVTPFDVEMARQSRSFSISAEFGELMFTTSDAIVAEVVYVLTARTHYSSDRLAAGAKVRRLLELDACQYSNKDACLLALEVWESHPKLSFPDCLAAACTELQGLELATFDATLRDSFAINIYSFPEPLSN
jgi:predicted nucleic acid-binding protein